PSFSFPGRHLNSPSGRESPPCFSFPQYKDESSGDLLEYNGKVWQINRKSSKRLSLACIYISCEI
ncbi:MAG: hypothetical protein WCS96_10700, partial [Victivallales bacterium]